MRRSKILAKIRSGQPARLAMMGYFLPPFVAYAAHMGYDGLWLDLEHRPFDQREFQSIMGYFHLYDIDCLVRPATREKAQLYRYLEDGAAGLVVPHLTRVEDAEALVKAVKFPPVGDRGMNPTGLEVDFGISGNRDTLIPHAQQETFVLAMLESPDAIRNAESYAAIPGLDGIFIGPSDLGIRMALEPADKQIPYPETMTRVAEACAKHNKVWGTTAQTTDDLRDLRDRKANFLVWGTDVHLLRAALTQTSKDLDTVLSGN